MVYQQKLVAVVKCNGKVLREKGDTVFLPFGSEYSLLFKNLNSRKAEVSVSIDGEDVLNGRKLIVEPNSDMELERFLRGDMNRGNRFKFIQKTDEIVKHRGDRVDDGMIRIEYRFEKDRINVPIFDYVPSQITYTSWGGTGCSADPQYRSCNVQSDEGLTVEGGQSNQAFQRGYIGAVEDNSHVIVIRLKGSCGEQQVQKPVTVKTEIQCKTCAKKGKPGDSFCSRCGTALEII